MLCMASQIVDEHNRATWVPLTPQVLLSAVQRLQQAGVARAFAAWACRVQAVQQMRATVQTAVGRWAAAAVGAAFRRWRGWAAKRAHHLQLAAGALSQQQHCEFTVAGPLAKVLMAASCDTCPLACSIAAREMSTTQQTVFS